MSKQLVILSGQRTPFGSYGGSLKDLGPADLGVFAAKAALNQSKVGPDQIDHVIVGNVLHSAPDSIYTPRHIGLKSGVPQDRPALGINRACGSGFEVIIDAQMQMQMGDTQFALVGGVENMSMAPYSVWGARWGLRMGNSKFVDTMTEALTDSYTGDPMAVTAENLAVKYEVSREDADAFALRSQMKVKAGIEKGIFKEEICPVEIKDRKGKVTVIEADEHFRPKTTTESLSKLKPVFKKNGTVTAGNASGIVDGAAMMVVATEDAAKKHQLKPLGKLVSYASVGCDPKIMGIGPAPAIRMALKKAEMKLDQMDLIEVNEAFAPQALSVQREIQIPKDKMNVNGGAIAIGHPLAASGTRIMMHLLYELRRRNQRYAIGSACIGGGQGIALIVESFQ